MRDLIKDHKKSLNVAVQQFGSDSAEVRKARKKLLDLCAGYARNLIWWLDGKILECSLQKSKFFVSLEWVDRNRIELAEALGLSEEVRSVRAELDKLQLLLKKFFEDRKEKLKAELAAQEQERLLARAEDTRHQLAYTCLKWQQLRKF